MYLVSIILLLYYIGTKKKIVSFLPPPQLFQPPLLLVFEEISNPPAPPPPIILNPPSIRFSRVFVLLNSVLYGRFAWKTRISSLFVNVDQTFTTTWSLARRIFLRISQALVNLSPVFLLNLLLMERFQRKHILRLVWFCGYISSGNLLQKGQDDKEKFLNNLACRNINHAKCEIRRINKSTLNKIRKTIQIKTNIKQSRNLTVLTDWFKNISDAEIFTWTHFIYQNFYPSVSEELLKKSIVFTKI